MRQPCEQMFDNKILQIIAIIWLLKHPQLNLSVAGQPAIPLPTEVIITAVATTQLQREYKKNIEKYAIKTYDMTRYHSANNNSTSSAGSSNSTTTAGNKLNVNNTDTQMTLKLKDATAINAFTTNYNKTFTLAAITRSANHANVVENSNMLEHIPSPTTAAGQLSQNTIKPSERSSLLSSHATNHYTTQQYFNHKEKFNKSKKLLHMNFPKSSKINSAYPNPTTTENAIMNINSINATELSQQQQVGDRNERLYSSNSKDIQETTSKSIKSAELIKKDKSVQAVHKSNQTASGSLMNEKKEKHWIQTNFNTTNRSCETNKVENNGNSEVKAQKQLKIFNHMPKESENSIADSKRFSENSKTSNEYSVDEKVSNVKNSTTKTFGSPQVTTTRMKKITFTKSLGEKVESVTRFGNVAKKDIFRSNFKASNATNQPGFSDMKHNSAVANISFVQRSSETHKEKSALANTKSFNEIRQSILVSSQVLSTARPNYETSALQESKIEEKLLHLKETQLKYINELDSKLQQMHTENKMLRDDLNENWQRMQDEKPTEETENKMGGMNAKISQANYQERQKYLERNEGTPRKALKTGNSIVNQETNYGGKDKQQQLQKEKSDNQHEHKNQKPSLHEIKNVNEILLNSTFTRNKRLHGNENGVESPTISSTALTKNHTTIYHNNLSENKSKAFDSYKLNQNHESKPLTKQDAQSMININATQNTLRNESVEQATEHIRQSNFINQRKQSALNTVSGNGSHTMKINNLMNKKSIDSNLNKNNQSADNEKYAVNETNAINLKTVTRPSVTKTFKSKTEAEQKPAEEATTKGYLITDINFYNITPTVATTEQSWEFQTTLATALSTPATFIAHPFILYPKRHAPANAAQHLFSASDVILQTHDLISNKLITATEQNNIMTLTNTSSTTQLSSSSATLPFKYATDMSALHRLSAVHLSPSSSPFTAATAATTTTSSWPVKHASVMEGNVILGGLMMVHSREDSITCGPIMPQGGVQALEAMLYTLDQVNKQQLLPNITLGAHILDDCDKDTYGLEMAVDFIKGESPFA